MTIRRYTLINPERVKDHVWSIHKVGCADVAKELKANGGTKELIRVNLDDEDDVMDALDVDDLGYTIFDVKVFPCTGHDRATEKAAKRPAKKAAAKPAVTATKPVPTSKPLKNGAAQDAANAKAQRIIEAIVDKIIAARGKDDIGTADKWEDDRLDTCNDYVYDLAVEVRKLREGGAPWWRIGQELMLPGAGASATQGKTGAAYARRLWERAWGNTYSGEKAPRDTKLRRQERAVTEAHRPYFKGDEHDKQIIDQVSGSLLHWVTRLGTNDNGIVTSAQQAYVHPDPRTIHVKLGPQGKYLEFYEAIDADNAHLSTSGPHRSVYLDRITRVGV